MSQGAAIEVDLIGGAKMIGGVEMTIEVEISGEVEMKAEIAMIGMEIFRGFRIPSKSQLSTSWCRLSGNMVASNGAVKA